MPKPTAKSRNTPLTEEAAGGSRRPATLVIVAFILAAALFAAAAFSLMPASSLRIALGDADIYAPARFVGSEACASCHSRETELWRTSHHAKAMAHASPKTVLGDFKNVTFDYHGVQSRMFRDGERFMVETDGPDGELATFEVKYTFGIEPLQQYLVEFADGRVQALPLAWDTRPREKGGQRWFHLYPDEKVDHTDLLHWTKLNQNWNFMCAECHSTGVRKNYDATSDRYKTTFAEISVGCEACHGQGSRHVAWARAQRSWSPFAKQEDTSLGLLVRFAERLNATWPIDSATGTARRSTPPSTLRKEVESCGMCHARRGQTNEDWTPGRWLAQTHAISPLGRGLYDASGQMEDEVFNYGSFKQSKMYAAGVTCGDCHEPHSAKLRQPGDTVCLQCHQAETFLTPAHHRHENVITPVTCANCHMPVRTYMVVDDRHDHSFRVPRPDVSANTGVRNACNDCHQDKDAQWAASAVETWHGPQRKGFQTFFHAFSSARTNSPDAGRLLLAVANDRASSPIARATALTELAAHVSPAAIQSARAAMGHSDPMMRVAALEMLEGLPPQQAWPIAAPLLSDPVRGVRMRAAALLAALPPPGRPAPNRRAFDQAAAEFIEAQTLNADRPEARSSLGTFYLRQGRVADAEAEFKAALKLSPQFAPAVVNLSDLYRQTNREPEALAALRKGLESLPRNAMLLHSLGLSLVRARAEGNQAIDALARASDIAPENARYGYVHAVALHSFGRVDEATEVLRRVLVRHPGDRDTLAALVAFEQQAGNIAVALDYAERLRKIMPEDPSLPRLVEELRKRSADQGR